MPKFIEIVIPNLIIFFGVSVLEWNIFEMFIIIWIENIIIGLVHILEWIIIARSIKFFYKDGHQYDFTILNMLFIFIVPFILLYSVLVIAIQGIGIAYLFEGGYYDGEFISKTIYYAGISMLISYVITLFYYTSSKKYQTYDIELFVVKPYLKVLAEIVIVFSFVCTLFYNEIDSQQLDTEDCLFILVLLLLSRGFVSLFIKKYIKRIKKEEKRLTILRTETEIKYKKRWR